MSLSPYFVSRKIPLSLFGSQTPALLPSGGHTALLAGAAGSGSLWQDLMSFSFHRPLARPFAVWRIRRPRLYARTGGNAAARLSNGDPRRERPSEFLIVTRSQDRVDEIGTPRYLMLTGSPHIAFPPLNEIALCQRGVFVNHAFSEMLDEDRCSRAYFDCKWLIELIRSDMVHSSKVMRLPNATAFFKGSPPFWAISLPYLDFRLSINAGSLKFE